MRDDSNGCCPCFVRELLPTGPTCAQRQGTRTCDVMGLIGEGLVSSPLAFGRFGVEPLRGQQGR